MRLLRFFALASLLASLSFADTVVSAGQNSNVFEWGVSNTATYGQTVTTPVADTELASFTFNLGPQWNGSGNINYEAWVYQWSSVNNRATGPALYQSALQTYTPGAGYTPVTFNPGIDLVAGDQYVMFLSTSGLQSGRPQSTIYWGSNSSNDYTGGSFVFLNNGDNASQWTNANWNVGFSGAADLAFTADFKSTPEPSSFAAFGVLAALIGWKYRRHRSCREVC
jgi:hypothetical protein